MLESTTKLNYWIYVIFSNTDSNLFTEDVHFVSQRLHTASLKDAHIELMHMYPLHVNEKTLESINLIISSLTLVETSEKTTVEGRPRSRAANEVRLLRQLLFLNY